MNHEQLIEALNGLMDQVVTLKADLDNLMVSMDDDMEAEELEAPDYDYVIGDTLDFANVKDGNMEFLTGTVFEVDLHDENGWYARVQTREGRKFRVPATLAETRLGTRIMRVRNER